MSTRAAAWRLDLPRSSHPEETTLVPDDGRRDDESIIGYDERVPVDYADFRDGGKYRSIVKIQSCFQDKGTGEQVWMMGTGYLVRPDLLITAGHVVFDWGHRLGAATQVKCFMGYNGRSSVRSPDTQARYGQKVITTAEWVDSKNNRGRDVAFIQVHRPFTGNLGVFAFIDTPSPAEIFLGVVGYPGDKILEGPEGPERGAQMYEEFKRVNVDVATNGRHMIEYPISTFGGQCGAPILNRAGGRLVSIGTHCYGGGGGDEFNSGTSIMGQYGNNYYSFINLFNSDQSFQNAEGVQIIETNDPRTVESETESFFDVLKSVANIGSPDFAAQSNLLGRVGPIICPAAGSIFGSFAQRLKVDNNGSIERAILAESTFQAILSAENTPDLMDIIKKMEQIWSKNNTNLDGLVKALTPTLTECALELIPHTESISRDSNSMILLEPRSLKISPPDITGTGADFVEGIFRPTRPLSGEEGIIDFIGTLLHQALGTAKPIVSPATSAGLQPVVGKLTALFGGQGFANEQSEPFRHEEATCLLLKRAIMGDIALQAAMTLPGERLARINITHYDNLRGDAFFDFIKTKVQQYSPTVLSIIKNTTRDFVKKYRTVVTDDEAKNVNHNLAPSASERPQRQPSLLDILNGKADDVKVHDTSKSLSATTERVDIHARLDPRRETWAPLEERRHSLDSNPDAPIMMPEPPADW